MDQKAYVCLEVKKEDNVFKFLMPMGAPLGQAYDAAFACLQEIVSMSKAAAERAKPEDAPAVEAKLVEN